MVLNDFGGMEKGIFNLERYANGICFEHYCMLTLSASVCHKTYQENNYSYNLM